jgi:hypothetical protein
MRHALGQLLRRVELLGRRAGLPALRHAQRLHQRRAVHAPHHRRLQLFRRHGGQPLALLGLLVPTLRLLVVGVHLQHLLELAHGASVVGAQELLPRLLHVARQLHLLTLRLLRLRHQLHQLLPRHVTQPLEPAEATDLPQPPTGPALGGAGRGGDDPSVPAWYRAAVGRPSSRSSRTSSWACSPPL